MIQPSFAKKPVFRISKIHVGTQKIDGSKLESYRIMIALVQLDDKDRKSRFFEKTFLLADISLNIAFGMLFLILSNVKINFENRKLK